MKVFDLVDLVYFFKKDCLIIKQCLRSEQNQKKNQYQNGIFIYKCFVFYYKEEKMLEKSVGVDVQFKSMNRYSVK